MQDGDNNYFEGYSVFLDFGDRELRTRNQAVVLGNITEHNLNDKGVSDKGRGQLVGYFGLIPVEDRALVWVKYVEYVRDVLKVDLSLVLKAAKGE